MITSPQNPKLKLVRALQSRAKERREAGAFIVEGVRLVEDAFAAGWPFKFALYAAELNLRAQALIAQMQAAGIETDEVPASLLQSLSDTETPQGVLAVATYQPLPAPNNPTFVLIPDAIRDPGNLGTLLRTAAAAGVDEVFIPPETTDAFSPKVVRSGMGAHFRLPIINLDWDEIATRLHGMSIFLADAAGNQTCWDADFVSPLSLVVGGEAEGASAAARRLAATMLNIPMPGKMESLNAGVAGSILMFEVVRQRRNKLQRGMQ